MNDVLEQVGRLRDFVCRGRIMRSIEARGPENYDNLCTVMDVLEDAQLAIEAFRAHSDKEEPGEIYLAAYGILEALFLQQEAIEQIGISTGFNQPFPEVLARIRGIRNDLASHPVRNRGERSTNSIIRALSTSKIVHYLKRSRDGKTSSFEVDLVKEANEQQRSIEEMLDRILHGLGNQEIEHMKKFAGTTLLSLLPRSLNYFIEKLGEAAISTTSPQRDMVEQHLDYFLEAMDKLENGLKDRSEYENGGVFEYEIKEAREVIERLRALFRGESLQLDLIVYVSYLEKKMRELKTMAGEMDSEYQLECGTGENGTIESPEQTVLDTLEFVDPK